MMKILPCRKCRAEGTVGITRWPLDTAKGDTRRDYNYVVICKLDLGGCGLMAVGQPSYLTADDAVDGWNRANEVAGELPLPVAENPEVKVGLSEAEKSVLTLTRRLHNEYVILPGVRHDEIADFVAALHRIQDLVAAFVARRADPDVWQA
jgi:hypothetical protein